MEVHGVLAGPLAEKGFGVRTGERRPTYFPVEAVTRHVSSNQQSSFEDEQSGRGRTRSTESRASDDRTVPWEDLLLEAGELVLRTVLRQYVTDRQDERSTGDTRRRNDAVASTGGESGGRSSLVWLAAGLGLLAAGYLIRDRYGPLGETIKSRSSHTAQSAADRTEEVSERAADRVREQGETVAERAEEVGEEAAQRAESAGERIEATSEDVADRVEEESEEVGEGIEEGGEEASDAVGTSQQG